MKVKVKVGFRDKHTKEYYSAGDVIEVTEERLEEIRKVGDLVERIKEENPEEQPAEGKAKRTGNRKKENE